jgi:hypothetical protein
MAPIILRKRARRLLKNLRRLQEDDVAITPPVLKETKYLFQYTFRCFTVHITYDELAASEFLVSRGEIPEFILSQLEIQKLTNETSARVPISTILHFIIQSLASNPESEERYPTFFSWYCAYIHRTRYIFAYVDMKMDSQVYSIRELLEMRGEQNSDFLSSLVNYKPDLGKFRPRNLLWVLMINYCSFHHP